MIESTHSNGADQVSPSASPTNPSTSNAGASQTGALAENESVTPRPQEKQGSEAPAIADPNLQQELTEQQLQPTNEEGSCCESEQIGAWDVVVAPDSGAIDGGYGWLIVLAAFLNNLLLDGLVYSFGVFFVPFLDYFEVSPPIVAISGSFLNGFYMLSGPVAGALVNKYGLRAVTITGGIISSVSLFLSTFSPNIVVFILTFGVAAGIGIGFIYLPSLVAVSLYFEKRRALATGIAVCGSGVGCIVFPIFVKLLLSDASPFSDWRATLWIVSALIANCCVFGAFFRPPPQAIPVRPASKAGSNASLTGHARNTTEAETLPANGATYTTEANSKNGIALSSGVAVQTPPDAIPNSKNSISVQIELHPVGTNVADQVDSNASASKTRIIRASIPNEQNVIASSSALESTRSSPAHHSQYSQCQVLPAGGFRRLKGNQHVPVYSAYDLTESMHSSATNMAPGQEDESACQGHVHPHAHHHRQHHHHHHRHKRSKNFSTSSDFRSGVSERSGFRSIGDFRFGSNRRQLSNALSGEEPVQDRPSMAGIESGQRVILQRPLSRKDIFYSGSIYNLVQRPDSAADSKIRPEDVIHVSVSRAALTSRLSIRSSRSLARSLDQKRDLETHDTADHTRIVHDEADDEASIVSDESVNWRDWCLAYLPEGVSQVLAEMSDVSLLKNRAFLLLFVANFFAILAYCIPFGYVVIFAKSIGIEDSRTTLPISLLGFTNTICRVLVGKIADLPRVDTLLLHNITLALAAVTVIMLPACRVEALLFLNLAVFGFLIAPYICLTSIIITEVVGINSLTNAFGLLIVSRGVACLVSLPVAGYMYELFDQSYNAMFITGGAMLLLASALHFLLHLPLFKLHFQAPKFPLKEQFHSTEEEPDEAEGEQEAPAPHESTPSQEDEEEEEEEEKPQAKPEETDLAPKAQNSPKEERPLDSNSEANPYQFRNGTRTEEPRVKYMASGDRASDTHEEDTNSALLPRIRIDT